MMMATFGLQIFISAVLVSFFGVQVDCHVERYALNIVENGTMVNEEIDVNVEEQTEVIRVPQHNDVDASDVLHDFASGLSARRVPSTQDCFVSKLDPSMPSPQEMTLDMDQASKQRLPDKVEIVKTVTRELGFANRSALPQKILDFCGSFPVYNVEEVPLANNAFVSKAQGQGRKKRSHIHNEYHMCSKPDEKRLEYCHNNHGFNFTLKCRFKTAYCYYVTTCKHIGPSVISRKYKCTGISHRLNYRGLCCKAICT